MTYQHPDKRNNSLLGRVFLHIYIPISIDTEATASNPTESLLTALTSARFPHLAKCALKLAFELPPATPQRALSTPAALRTATLRNPASASGDKQSNNMATSLNTSAASRYVLHSGSMAVPTLCAKMIVASRPVVSWRLRRRRADVGEALALPTPTPVVVCLL